MIIESIYFLFQCRDASGLFSVASYPIYEEVQSSDTKDTYHCLFEPTEFPDFSNPTTTLQPLLSKQHQLPTARPSQVSRQSRHLPGRLQPRIGLNDKAVHTSVKPNIFSVESSHYQSVPVVDTRRSSHISDKSVKSQQADSVPNTQSDRLIRSQTMTSFRSSNQTLSTNGSDS